MICGHGSRDEEAVAEFQSLARGMRERLPQYDVESGFLEFARPTIQEGLKKLMERGVTEILAAPAILFAAGHVKNDIPWELNSFAASHPVLSLSCGRDLSIEPKLLMAARDRIQAAMETAGGGVAAADTLLMVVGRGTNDPDANSNVSKVARMLWEGMDLGWAETCYSGVAHPRVDKGLERVAAMSFQRIIVFPYFLFTGVLVKRIYAQMAEVASKYPGTEFVAASYLNDHPRVLDTLAERVTGITEGDNAMNCLLCKYREQVVGFEDAQGQPQAGHHHHVRGIGTGHDHDHAHDHGPAKEPA
ncbi:MAG TPA: sirohydrochlorin chelatase [Rhodospirillaceae bacterium]|nr:sirohydrochlorin chelatase [Rhodospirillaceae bacterium]